MIKHLILLITLCTCFWTAAGEETRSIAVVANTQSARSLAQMVLDAMVHSVDPLWVSSQEGLEAQLEKASESDAHAILVIGVAGTEAVLHPQAAWQKPVVAGMVYDETLFGIKHDQAGRSGKENVNFVGPGPRFSRDLHIFGQLMDLQEVTFLVDPELADHPILQERLAHIGETAGVAITAVGLGDAVSQTSKGPVIMGPMESLIDGERRELIQDLTVAKRPVYAMMGDGDVERGAFAGALKEADKRLAARLASNLDALLDGERAHHLPTWLSSRERLVINGFTARSLGVKPSLELRLLADFIHPEAFQQDHKLNLRAAVETALNHNADLAARRHETQGFEYEKRMADAQWLPQIDAAASHQSNDPENPQIAAGFSPENSTQAAVQASQVLFNDSLLTQSRVARKNLEGAKAMLKAGELEIVNGVAGAYLGLLSKQALLDIEIENLKLTRVNLRTARIRLQLGSGGNEEVYRWESQEAQQLGAVFRARADVSTAEAGLARLLGMDPVLNQSLEPAALTARDSAFLDSRWNQMLQRVDGRVETLLLEQARSQSPEVQSAEAAETASKIQVGGAKRSFYLPSISFKANYQDLLDQEFTPGTTPLFPQNESGTWSMELSAGISLFSGGRKTHQLGLARARQQQFHYQKKSAEEGAGERLVRALAKARASLPNIELTTRAADRASRNLEIVLDKYEQGKASILDLLEAQDQDLTQRRQSVLASYDHLANLFELQRALSYFDLLLEPEAREAWLQNLETNLAALDQHQEGEAL